MIILIIIAILVCLGSGTFALLNWQTTETIWAQPVVFIAGALIVLLIKFIAQNKD